MTNAQIEQIKEKIKRLGYEYEQVGLFHEIKIPAGKGYRYVGFDTLEKLSDYLDREGERNEQRTH